MTDNTHDDEPMTFNDRIENAEHPGTITTEEAISGSDRAIEWYNDAVWYAARLFVESGRDHDAVADALIAVYEGDANERLWDVPDAQSEHDPERAAAIDEIGLSVFQATSAMQQAGKHLADEVTE